MATAFLNLTEHGFDTIIGQRPLGREYKLFKCLGGGDHLTILRKPVNVTVTMFCNTYSGDKTLKFEGSDAKLMLERFKAILTEQLEGRKAAQGAMKRWVAEQDAPPAPPAPAVTAKDIVLIREALRFAESHLRYSGTGPDEQNPDFLKSMEMADLSRKLDTILETLTTEVTA